MRFYLFMVLLFMFNSCQKNEQRHSSQLYLNFQEGDLPSLHPHLLSSHIRGHVIGKLLFEGLTRIDAAGNPSLAGAEQVEVSSDGKKYLFTLRDQYWSDGTKVTAEHYACAWRHALTPSSDCPRADLFYLIKNGQKAKKGEIPLEEVGVQALNSSTLAVELEYPSPYFLQLVAHPLLAPMQSPQEEPKAFNGPFTLSKWHKGVSLQLTPNPHFWNSACVQLSQIHIDCVTDPATAFYMFEKGDIDWIGNPLSPLSKEATTQLIENNQAFCEPFDRFYWIYLNTTHPLLKSVKIRKALSLSVERKQITKHICAAGEPLLTLVNEKMIPAQAEQEDIIKARQLFNEGLEELGFTRNTSPLLTLSYGQFACQKPLAEYLKNRWEQAFGVSIELQGNEWNVFRSNLECGRFEIGGCLANAFYGDPLEFLELFEELGNGNFSQWEHEVFKEKLTAIRREEDAKKRMQLLVEAQGVLLEEAPIIPVYRGVHVYAHNRRLKNYVFDNAGRVDFAYAFFVR